MQPFSAINIPKLTRKESKVGCSFEPPICSFEQPMFPTFCLRLNILLGRTRYYSKRAAPPAAFGLFSSCCLVREIPFLYLALFKAWFLAHSVTPLNFQPLKRNQNRKGGEEIRVLH